jgi:hypothetical protein
MIALGLDPRTGKPLADEFIAGKERTQQFTDYNSQNAKTFSSILGGILTPQQLDALADQGGLVGDLIQAGSGKRPGVAETITGAFKTAFVETKARTPEKIASQQYFKDTDEIGKQIVDRRQFRIWQAFRSARTNKLGEKTDSTLLDSAQKALELLNNNEVLAGERELNRRSAERGGLANPLFDNTLTDEQRRRVLTYRSMRINNAAKQNYTKNGESAFISLGLDEAWYKDFQTKEKAYWEEVAKRGDKEQDKSLKTFSGKPAPKPSPQLEAKLDFYYTLPKGTGQRSAFLRANPDIIDFWDKQNDFTNEERAALGFKPLTEEEGQYGGRGRKSYTPRVNQPFIQARAQKPGGLGRLPGVGPQVRMRPGEVVVRRTEA